ncbi:MAG: transcriptional regulator [Gammaproteobacteria bacterium]|jgi:HTH-type transcriptional regulator/antitoxin HigA|nr:transcriptional regulator [Gammaproteobacteria bacterium]
MDIRPIKTEQDYEQALERVESLFDARPDTPEGDELDVLVTLIEAWEDRHLAIEAPDPVEAIRFRMEQMGLQPKDLEPYIGGRGRVSEVLNRKRGLSLRMIRNLHEGLGLPYESLIPA